MTFDFRYCLDEDDENYIPSPDFSPETDEEWLAANRPYQYSAEGARERSHQLQAIPQADWPALQWADEATVANHAEQYRDQLPGAVQLQSLDHLTRELIGKESTSLTSIVDLGNLGADTARQLHGWVDPEYTAELVAERYDIRLPPPGQGGVTVEGNGQRLESAKVWRRNFMRQHLQSLEYARIAAGQVRRGRQPVVSASTSGYFATRWKQSEQALRSAVALSDAGDEVSLFELQQTSVSNPRVRFAELITRARGFELIAEELGHVAVFVTPTCPGYMHPSKSVPIKRAKGQKAYRQVQNPAWVEAGKPTPKMANDYLAKLWAKVRAAAARRGLRVYGLRVAEPHADACPHWHMLLWGEPHELAMFIALFNNYACREAWDELFDLKLRKDGELDVVNHTVWHHDKDVPKGRDPVWRKKPASTVRFDVKQMQPAKITEDGRRVGGAVGYLTKYLTKNLDGRTEQKREDGEHLAMGDNHETGTDTVTGAQLARAWASLWRIRQFQFYGGPAVTLWRELRKLKGAEQDSVWLDWAVHAADQGDWATFCKLLGGPLAKRKDMPIKLAKEDQPEKTNCYGEAACAVVKGVEASDQTAITRTKSWRVEWRPQAATEGTATSRAARVGRSHTHLGLVPLTVRATPNEEPPTRAFHFRMLTQEEANEPAPWDVPASTADIDGDETPPDWHALASTADSDDARSVFDDAGLPPWATSVPDWLQTYPATHAEARRHA
ncbi:hypothetical protein GCM10007907_20860 [Chitinimonas prasina]|uniref:Replication gene A protein-like domain-containing protein n=1 Tax=Chitinimonas prasina TaxID=1434937 RepID=A0ABQ5YE96_9NEIS|nr:replication endonuclease [Chitinimonas prasina]GLR13296.1 hypothetical protein GCM10007907_20860 [Chitinimonas prasina]